MSKSLVTHKTIETAAIDREQFLGLYDDLRGGDSWADLIDFRLRGGELAATSALVYEEVPEVGNTSYLVSVFVPKKETTVTETTKFFIFRSTEVTERVYFDEQTAVFFEDEDEAQKHFSEVSRSY